MANYLFSVPTLPKPVYEDLMKIRDTFGISSQQMVILGVMAIKHLYKNDCSVAEQMIAAVRGVYCQDFKPSSTPK